MAIKGQAITVTITAVDASTGVRKTGDAANISVRLIKDGSSGARHDGTAIAEVDSTNCPGEYSVVLDATDTNANVIVVTGKSSTSNIEIIPTKIVTERGLMPAYQPSIDSDGRCDLGKWIGTAPLALSSQRVVSDVGAVSGDSGAADNLEAGFDGTGYAGGTVKQQVDLVSILGTALTETAGQIAAAFKKWFNVATPTGTVNSIPDAVAGAASGLAIVGSVMGKSPATLAAADVSGYLPANAVQVEGGDATDAIAAAAAAGVLATPAQKLATNASGKAAATIAAGDLATDSITADALKADAVTEIQTGLATSANQTTILNRLGAWTGSGVNTLLGAFKALTSKAASAPSDIGGTFDPATDSTDAIRDTAPLGTAMRGTDGAYTGTPPTAVAIRQEMDSNSTKLANLDAAVTSREASGAAATAVGTLNDLSAADAAAAAAAALAAYDPPTKTEMDAAHALLATAASIAALNNVSTAQVLTQVQAALGAAIPGSPTADSIYERIKTFDDAYTAARAAYLDELAAANLPTAVAAAQSAAEAAQAAAEGVGEDAEAAATAAGAAQIAAEAAQAAIEAAAGDITAAKESADSAATAAGAAQTAAEAAQAAAEGVDADAIAETVGEEVAATLAHVATDLMDSATAGAIEKTRGTTWTIPISGLTSLTTAQQIYFSVKKAPSLQSDDDALLRVSKTVGLERIAKAAAATAANASIAVNSATALTVAVKAVETAKIGPGDYYYDLKVVAADGTVTKPDSGTFTVHSDVTRAVS